MYEICRLARHLSTCKSIEKEYSGVWDNIDERNKGRE
jgi:hypothetical protein